MTADKARRGRPPRGDARATARAGVPLTPAEKTMLLERADAAELDFAEYARRALFAYDAGSATRDE